MASRMKLTPKRYEVIIGMLEKGHYDTTAARTAGIAPGTMKSWIDKGRKDEDGIYYEFALAVEVAHQKGEGFLVGKIIDAVDANDWRAAAWILERKYHKNWSKQSKVEVAGPQGGPIRLAPPTEEQITNAYVARLEAAKGIAVDVTAKLTPILNDPMFS